MENPQAGTAPVGEAASIRPTSAVSSSRLALVNTWLSRRQSPTDGLPSWILNVMDTGWTERLLEEEEGRYWSDPEGFVARQYQAIGTAFCDQFLTQDPAMRRDGWRVERSLGPLVRDGIVIDSPEAVCEHLERHVWPDLEERIAGFDGAAPGLREQFVVQMEALRARLGPEIAAAPYIQPQAKPTLRYGDYGYENYFMFYALYPEAAERSFRLEADYAVLHNAALAEVMLAEGYPPMVRVDHDITDSRGTLASMESMEERYLPHYARALQPLVERGIRLLYHCDGNVNPLIPWLLETGFAGFQGFQYEDGMDYPAIARMTTRAGEPLVLIVGASVTTTLVQGTPEDVRREVDWLVENSADASLALGATSSICPGTPWKNIDALVESLQYYQEHGKAGLRGKVGKHRPFAGH